MPNKMTTTTKLTGSLTELYKSETYSHIHNTAIRRHVSSTGGGGTTKQTDSLLGPYDSEIYNTTITPIQAILVTVDLHGLH
jgi:hypothetical protein